LVVDDVQANIEVVKLLLRPYELSIDEVVSGFEAIEKLENGLTYDIIFMDHIMPKMDGIETTWKIRRMGYDKPIVALTANAVENGQEDMYLKNGFDGFIAKPVNIRHLDEVLLKFIRDRHV
jgi:CheY-like chemotaxis protein